MNAQPVNRDDLTEPGYMTIAMVVHYQWACIIGVDNARSPIIQWWAWSCTTGRYFTLDTVLREETKVGHEIKWVCPWTLSEGFTPIPFWVTMIQTTSGQSGIERCKYCVLICSKKWQEWVAQRFVVHLLITTYRAMIRWCLWDVMCRWQSSSVRKIISNWSENFKSQSWATLPIW